MLSVLKYLWIKLYLNVIGAWKSLQEQVWDRHRPIKDLPKGIGKVVVITGGSHGIGFEATKVFLNLGYRVMVGCRKPSDLKETLTSLKANGNLGSGEFDIFPLDLMSMTSVREFARHVLKKNVPIHVLVNNAGIMFGPRTITEDGFESQMSVNHLGHFLLTHLLLPKLKSSGTPEAKARILNVSSAAHYIGSLMDLNDIHSSQFYSPEGGYGNSKAAQVLCTYYLNPQLEAEAANVTINCFHPGVISTGLYQNARYVKFVNLLAFSMLMKTPREGADSILHAAISPEMEGRGGLYLENAQPRISSAFTRDLSNQERMFKLSCDALEIPYDKFGR
ncbi:hypothetical protein TCAL_12862 [Tigriopus californicus]|uniref:Uncharacterized protein n=1 Tax=Tigriopus californicus TaxID=6832 RepID=A0A553P8I2_TIGCA|nr:dehydrogenase/reductase SDR family member on chromosome X-like [Tigriopus californicus]TRY73994.1 hypothetical protein TCAL_12862 [Tigriopus californicus]|eukprot:TCALIF_12862-PA protein Name:"Similar to DHRSX Dehydrogenase/reductase SDR family member on chromosome X (Homo sapiens)" AED:0.07 eAED:0.07 QI:134/1/1/1/0.6/0.66/6/42/333